MFTSFSHKNMISMANLPAEKVNELKQLIHSHLNQTDVHSKIKDCLDESFVSNERHRNVVEEGEILNVLRERGLVDEVMKTLKFEGIEKKGDEHERSKAGEPREKRVGKYTDSRGKILRF